ncbi:MAG: phosphotriesterase family protein [Chitinophagaceae bacterium]
MAKRLNRRKFIRQSVTMLGGSLLVSKLPRYNTGGLMTVNGWTPSDKTGFILSHEHILVDFIGAGKVTPARYDANEVCKIALPKLLAIKERGCNTMVECTPAWLGRDVRLLKRLSVASGLNIITNTGYYGAAGEKYLPAHAFTETASEVAARWINEWKYGVENSGIKPGFIKSGVDKFPLSGVQRKMVEASAITHLATGLTIGIHTGDGAAAMEEMKILETNGVNAEAWIWIHAQNESNRDFHFRAAKSGGWVSFDNVNKDSLFSCLDFLLDMKKENLLHHVLLSHDAGWYHVGEVNGGNFRDYTFISDNLVPALTEKGFTEKEIHLLFFNNPAKAFTVRIRKT